VAVSHENERRLSQQQLIMAALGRGVRSMWHNARLQLYGSTATGLALPSSDLDLVICFPPAVPFQKMTSTPTLSYPNKSNPIHISRILRPPHPGYEEPTPGSAPPVHYTSWQSQLRSWLVGEKWVMGDSIQTISHTENPIISLLTATDELRTMAAAVAQPAAALQSGGSVEQLEENLDAANWAPMRVDVTVEGPHHEGIAATALTKHAMKEYPLITPITLVVKQFLLERDFGVSFTGGLSSYGVMLLVWRYLQFRPTDSPSEALVGFMQYYGKDFDPHTTGVSVARSAFVNRSDQRDRWPKLKLDCAVQSTAWGRPGGLHDDMHKFDTLFIEDPLDIHKNVGRNCFRIRQIQRAWAEAYDKLTAAEGPDPVTVRTILNHVDGEVPHHSWTAESVLAWHRKRHPAREQDVHYDSPHIRRSRVDFSSQPETPQPSPSPGPRQGSVFRQGMLGAQAYPRKRCRSAQRIHVDARPR